jgi:hypothetical protein
LCGLTIKKGDVLLVLGARTSDKYGSFQLNISAENGKVLVNPKGYQMPSWTVRKNEKTEEPEHAK